MYLCVCVVVHPTSTSAYNPLYALSHPRGDPSRWATFSLDIEVPGFDIEVFFWAVWGCVERLWGVRGGPPPQAM
eukprot:3859173-Pyramimonas_sp.AAC.1